MSIKSEIERLKDNVAASYAAVEERGGVLPQERTSANLAAAIRSIPAGGGDVALEGIEITAPPNHVSYRTGVLFDPTGMSVWASFSNGYGLYVNHSDLVFDPAGPLEEGTKAVTVRFSWGRETVETAQAISVRNASIYGVEWSGSSTTKWTRTDDAAGFSDPVPAVNNGTGSSPFDDLYPWSDMVRETRAGGVEVKEPKYWFKWTKTGKKMKLQIADGPVDGFHVDPVNMDRGDGLGELDFSYIGRYHCVSDNWKSETNKLPKYGITRSAARTGIHSLGDHIWQIDYAQMWYVGMLYLVEFADWDGQAKIGYGCSSNSRTVNNGATDAMKYHTGTTAAKRTTYGFTQYRNIEGWWDNVFDWLDGCYRNTSGLNIVLDPNKFSDSANGVLVGNPVVGYLSEFAVPTQNGLEWALYPNAASGSTTTYVTDMWAVYNNGSCLRHGGCFAQSLDMGPFRVEFVITTYASGDIGCRLQERPPKAA